MSDSCVHVPRRGGGGVVCSHEAVSTLSSSRYLRAEGGSVLLRPSPVIAFVCVRGGHWGFAWTRSGSSAVARSSARLAEWCLGKDGGIQPLYTYRLTPTYNTYRCFGTRLWNNYPHTECLGGVCVLHFCCDCPGHCVLEMSAVCQVAPIHVARAHSLRPRKCARVTAVSKGLAHNFCSDA